MRDLLFEAGGELVSDLDRLRRSLRIYKDCSPLNEPQTTRSFSQGDH